jgi:hypothetical protein
VAGGSGGRLGMTARRISYSPRTLLSDDRRRAALTVGKVVVVTNEPPIGEPTGRPSPATIRTHHR